MLIVTGTIAFVPRTYAANGHWTDAHCVITLDTLLPGQASNEQPLKVYGRKKDQTIQNAIKTLQARELTGTLRLRIAKGLTNERR